MTKQSLFACALVFTGICAYAQTPVPQSTILTSTLYQVEADKVEQYDQYIRTTGRKIMQALVDNGDVASATHYKIVVPNGIGPAATHLAVIEWAKQPLLDPSDSERDAIYKKAGISRAGVLDSLRPIGRKTVGREVWRLYDRAGEPPAVGDFVRLDPKKVTSMQQYAELERKTWKPIHEQRIKAGALKGWAALLLVIPGGEDYRYQAATAEVYKDEAQMFLPVRIPDMLKLAHPDRDVSADMKTMSEVGRNLARSILRVEGVVRAQAR